MENHIVVINQQNKTLRAQDEVQRAEIMMIPKHEEQLLRETKELVKRKEMEIMKLDQKQKK